MDKNTLMIQDGNEQQHTDNKHLDAEQCGKLKKYLTRRNINFKEKTEGNSVVIEINTTRLDERQSY